MVRLRKGKGKILEDFTRKEILLERGRRTENDNAIRKT